MRRLLPLLLTILDSLPPCEGGSERFLRAGGLISLFWKPTSKLTPPLAAVTTAGSRPPSQGAKEKDGGAQRYIIFPGPPVKGGASRFRERGGCFYFSPHQFQNQTPRSPAAHGPLHRG